MPKSSYPEGVPAAPEPSSPTAADGMQQAQKLARRYLVDNVRVLAGIALSADSEAKLLQLRATCIKEIDAIAGVIPQPVPTPPPPHGEDDGGGELAS